MARVKSSNKAVPKDVEQQAAKEPASLQPAVETEFTPNPMTTEVVTNELERPVESGELQTQAGQLGKSAPPEEMVQPVEPEYKVESVYQPNSSPALEAEQTVEPVYERDFSWTVEPEQTVEPEPASEEVNSVELQPPVKSEVVVEPASTIELKQPSEVESENLVEPASTIELKQASESETVAESIDPVQSQPLSPSAPTKDSKLKGYVPKTAGTKKRIHFWSGESGGVGKSTGCKAMIHYLDAVLDRQDFRLIDADRSKPDVKDAYSTALGERCLEGFFSEATDLFSKADEILNAALYGDVVVNLPASVGAALEQWVKNTDLILVAAESNIELIVWFVSNGSPDSMRLFYESLGQWGAGVNHVLVRNFGLNRNSEVWEKFAASDEYQKAKQQHGFKEFDLPMLYDAAKISGATVPLQNFAANPQLLGIAGASRTRKFLKDVSASFDATGLFERPSVTS
ncbi:hypothetical protein NG798_26745 [Ancylothrix sp. C2]|uniref:hypothetical protein n=1 Tax=Ancylothrix sp. D3o TaxID=2953691 RepID=UPI0021BAB394|nr:hypothetical protein [Ancylothrix sp. D3o]MCT7953403.1 hypothetical protein [Ancylothrix sp. D3o]